VLEHQQNVGVFLAKCFDDLRDGGILAITVPPLKHEIARSPLTAAFPQRLVIEMTARIRRSKSTWAATGCSVKSGGVLELESGAIVRDSRGDAIKGFIPLALADAREVSSNATINAAGNGGLLASDTTPVFQRVNGATDKALRLNWAATNVDEITWSFAYPPDLDDTSRSRCIFSPRWRAQATRRR
jgi:hypothetical protein